MPQPYKGGCGCGAIRYTVNAEPVVSYRCHCTECQKRTSSAYGLNMQIFSEALTIDQGTPKERQRKADSGNELTLRFCGDCGSPLFGNSSGNPAVTVVYCGTLDDPSWLPVKANIFTDSALPTANLEPELEAFPRMPDFKPHYAAYQK